MLLRTNPTSLLQIFCEIMLDSKVILKSIKVPDDACTNISSPYSLHCNPSVAPCCFVEDLNNQSIFLKEFDREMLLRTERTILLQIFCEFMLYSKVILKSIKVPDDACTDICSPYSLHCNPLVAPCCFVEDCALDPDPT